MTKEREALNEALIWFKCYRDNSMSRNNAEALADEVIETIHKALAQPAQEPVAWMRPSEEECDSAFRDHSTVMACTGNLWTGWIPLYTTPPAAPQKGGATCKE